MEPDLPQLGYALDASLIDLSLALFPWANWQHTDAAVKLHTLLSLRGAVPAWTAVTEGRVHDSKMLAEIPIEKGAFYVLDRGYLDFRGLARIHAAGAFFVVRSKCHLALRAANSRPIDKSLGLRCDQTVKLVTGWSQRRYNGPLRRIRIYDDAGQRSLVLLTNHFELPASTVAELYRRRWQVELFFKWIKQHLRLRAFLGRSQNAVRLQVWTAISSYLLVAIAKKEFGLPQSLHQILQVISVSVFEPVPLHELFSHRPLNLDHPNQLLLLP